MGQTMSNLDEETKSLRIIPYSKYGAIKEADLKIKREYYSRTFYNRNLSNIISVKPKRKSCGARRGRSKTHVARKFLFVMED